MEVVVEVLSRLRGIVLVIIGMILVASSVRYTPRVDPKRQQDIRLSDYLPGPRWVVVLPWKFWFGLGLMTAGLLV